MAGYSKQEGLGPSPFGWVPPGRGCGGEGAVAGAELRHFYCERTGLTGQGGMPVDVAFAGGRVPRRGRLPSRVCPFRARVCPFHRAKREIV